MPCRRRCGVWLLSEQAARLGPVTAWLETGARQATPSSGLPAVAFHDGQERRRRCSSSGSIPTGVAHGRGARRHRGGGRRAPWPRTAATSTAAELGGLFAPRRGLLRAATGPVRCWPSSSWLPGRVVDVPPTLSARVRLLDSGRSDKTDRHDARSAAVVALRHSSLRQVRADDHVAVLRLLAKRHHDLVAARTRADVDCTRPSATWPKATSPSA